MKILLDRPFTQYAKDIASMCELICQAQSVDASVYYCGFLDAMNNPVCQQELLDDPNTVIVIVINDYINNCNIHAIDMHKLSLMPKKFIFVTEVLNASCDFEHYENIHYVHMGMTLLADFRPWQHVEPQQFKNLLQGPHWLCLTRTARQHRTMVSAVLAELGLGFKNDSRGLMRIDIDTHGAIYPIENYDQWLKLVAMWLQNQPKFDATTDLQIPEYYDNRLRRGYQLLEQQVHHVQDPSNFLPNYSNNLDNMQNFDVLLRPLYQTAVVEVVLETVYFTKSVLLSEKYLNTVMGLTFPVIISSAGAVEYLRSLGLDMFDDVVDHSYDLENDHILRAFKAIERNQRLFTDGNFARQKWIECQSRFLKNLRIVQNELRYNAMTEFKAEFAKTLLKI